jgi:YacP-like NYN domain
MIEGAEIEHRHLRSAIEFAVVIAEEAQKRKPPMPVPNELRAFYGKPRIPTGALGRLRRAIEADDLFRQRIGAGALPDLVDDVGRLWLQRPSNWVADAEAFIRQAANESEAADTASALRRSERRRVAAEEAAVRSVAEITRLTAIAEEHQAEVDRLRADLTKADELLAEVRLELIDVRNEARHSRDREASANARLVAVSSERDALIASAHEIPPSAAVPDMPTDAELRQLRDLADASARAATDASQQVAEMLARRSRLAAETLAQRADAGSTAQRSGPVPHAGVGDRRRPVALPGGIIASSAEAASFLARCGAAVLIDGYNVAMLGWPKLGLEAQRSALIDAVENLQRRFGTDATIVFDGAEVVGAHAGRRRTARVVFSPAGVIADDVIRSEIARLPADRHVVVVTNDAEVVRDARSAGCNVVSSNALLALL